MIVSESEGVMSTKEKILDAALTLFAENGYDGTSVEQIANIVGIKAPSLYKHYKGKEDILNALIDSAEARYEEMFGSENNIGKLPQSREEFIKVTMERISEVTTRHQLDGIQGMFAKIIKGMMDEGIVKNDDPALLAAELTAPAVLQIARSDRQPQCEKECMEYIEKHLRHFCKIYMKK